MSPECQDTGAIAALTARGGECAWRFRVGRLTVENDVGDSLREGAVYAVAWRPEGFEASVTGDLGFDEPWADSPSGASVNRSRQCGVGDALGGQLVSGCGRRGQGGVTATDARSTGWVIVGAGGPERVYRPQGLGHGRWGAYGQ